MILKARAAHSRPFRTNRAAAIAHGEAPPAEPGGSSHRACSVEPEPNARRRRDAKIKPLAVPARQRARKSWPRRVPPGAAHIDGQTDVAEGSMIRAALWRRAARRWRGPSSRRPSARCRVVVAAAARRNTQLFGATSLLSHWPEAVLASSFCSRKF